MGLTRQEVNLRRLLAKCELMVKNNQNADQRLPKYIETLEEMLKEVKILDNVTLSLKEYERRIHNLKLQLGLVSETYSKRNSAVFDEDQNDVTNLSPREELLGIRQRNARKDATVGDLDEIINYHQNVQGKIAEDILSLARNLKDQSQLANRIIKKDTQVVGNSMQLTEQNYLKLKSEAETLADHSKRSCKCWMWLILVIVVMVFMCMVLFMKVAKKKY